ncbi:MAG: glycosyltransferase family 4 protein [Rhodoferax sp.]|uniref:glycosyltransferase family 4 protein n=1 Tax=Rhodoferax sp. TaxID=50421 RepID=UPI003BB5538C
MNIVILQGAFFPIPPLLGGAVEKMWFKLGQEFAKLGHHVTHISKQYSGLPDEELIDGVHHKRIIGYTSPKSMLIHKLLDAIYSWRAVKSIPTSTDIVITNSFWSPIFLLLNKRAVVYVDVARMPKGQLKFYSRADCLRANSGAVVAAMKDEIPATAHHRIRMVPNPLPFNVQGGINFEIKESIILYCGRVHEEKGLELLANAVNKIDLKGWRIQIVGPWDVSMGGSGEDYKNYLVKCFEKSNVEFTGPIFDESKLNEIYSRASIFVYPSLAEKGETFGLAPLEAMAWGNVPIVSNLTCFQDFIQHDKNGLIFDHRSTTPDVNLAESIKRLIENASLREYLAIEAINVRETHSTVNIAKQFIFDFELLINFRKARLAPENKFKNV